MLPYMDVNPNGEGGQIRENPQLKRETMTGKGLKKGTSSYSAKMPDAVAKAFLMQGLLQASLVRKLRKNLRENFAMAGQRMLRR